MSSAIYLDNNATTKTDPQVVSAMLPYFSDNYANASSNHVLGESVNRDVENARNNIVQLISGDPTGLVFTSGATEAINIAIKGIAEGSGGKRNHIVTVQTEHPAVIDTCRYLETIGFEVTYLPVNSEGLIQIEDLKNSLRENTVLVSVMMVNNETGVIQPIKEISEITHRNNSLFLCDATQAVGKIAINIHELDIDVICFSGHKFYGPKGIGCLYINKNNNLKVTPLIHGGGHEKGYRSGTLNVPAIIGLGEAAKIAQNEMKENEHKVQELRDYLEKSLTEIPGSKVNGSKCMRLFNVTNILFPGIDANVLIGRSRNIAFSNGSACSSSVIEPSHVLKAMGHTDDEASSSIRFSLGKFNTREEIDEAIIEIKQSINMLKSMNQLG